MPVFPNNKSEVCNFPKSTNLSVLDDNIHYNIDFFPNNDDITEKSCKESKSKTERKQIASLSESIRSISFKTKNMHIIEPLQSLRNVCQKEINFSILLNRNNDNNLKNGRSRSSNQYRTAKNKLFRLENMFKFERKRIKSKFMNPTEMKHLYLKYFKNNEYDLFDFKMKKQKTRTRTKSEFRINKKTMLNIL